MGIYYRSAWFITLAVYYGFLVFMRILLLRNTTVDSLGKNLVMEFKRYRVCAAALIAMLSLETTMITEFGNKEDTLFRNIMVSATGGGVSVIFIAMAIYMLTHSAKAIQKM